MEASQIKQTDKRRDFIMSKEILKKVLRASTDVVITIITATVEVQKKY